MNKYLGIIYLLNMATSMAQIISSQAEETLYSLSLNQEILTKGFQKTEDITIPTYQYDFTSEKKSMICSRSLCPITSELSPNRSLTWDGLFLPNGKFQDGLSSAVYAQLLAEHFQGLHATLAYFIADSADFKKGKVLKNRPNTMAEYENEVAKLDAYLKTLFITVNVSSSILNANRLLNEKINGYYLEDKCQEVQAQCEVDNVMVNKTLLKEEKVQLNLDLLPLAAGATASLFPHESDSYTLTFRGTEDVIVSPKTSFNTYKYQLLNAKDGKVNFVLKPLMRKLVSLPESSISFFGNVYAKGLYYEIIINKVYFDMIKAEMAHVYIDYKLCRKKALGCSEVSSGSFPLSKAPRPIKEGQYILSSMVFSQQDQGIEDQKKYIMTFKLVVKNSEHFKSETVNSKSISLISDILK
jgi:hypothetical protein